MNIIKPKVKKGLIAFATCTFFVLPVQSVESITQQIDKLTEQWIQIEQQERNLILNWQQQKPTIEQRIKLLKAEKKQLQDLLAQNDASQGDVELKRNELLAKQNSLEADQTKLAYSLTILSEKLAGKYSVLPDPVKSSWDQESAQLHDDSEASVTLQVLIAKLATFARFNKQLTINETVIQTPDKKDVLVKQFYLGTSIAWFSSSDGSYKGVGKVIDGQWTWLFDENINAKNILAAIAIYEKRQTPDFIELPISLTSASTNTKEQS